MLISLQLVQPSNMMKYNTLLLSQAKQLSLFVEDPSCINLIAFIACMNRCNTKFQEERIFFLSY